MRSKPLENSTTLKRCTNLVLAWCRELKVARAVIIDLYRIWGSVRYEIVDGKDEGILPVGCWGRGGVPKSTGLSTCKSSLRSPSLCHSIDASVLPSRVYLIEFLASETQE
jgi:hypothetical protein